MSSKALEVTFYRAFSKVGIEEVGRAYLPSSRILGDVWEFFYCLN